MLNAFNPALGNSAVADIGVYCLEPALDWFGSPLTHRGTSVRLENGFEALGSIQLDYGAMVVDVVYSKIVSGVTPSTIIGEKGALTIDNLGQPSLIEWLPRDGEAQVLSCDPDAAPMANMHFELLDFVMWCVKVFGQFGYATWVTCVVCCSHACAGVWYPSAEWGRIRL